MSQIIEPGDWVCFMQLGMPSYGCVMYVHAEEDDIVTTAGTTRAVDVLEVRKKP